MQMCYLKGMFSYLLWTLECLDLNILRLCILLILTLELCLKLVSIWPIRSFIGKMISFSRKVSYVCLDVHYENYQFDQLMKGV